MAIVVPTAACWLPSPTFISVIVANRRPASTTKPKSAINVWSGPLKGKDIRLALISPPGASTSLNSPGCNGSSSSLIRRPRALNPAGKFDSVPASINCLSAAVAVLDSPPMVWINPSP